MTTLDEIDFPGEEAAANFDFLGFEERDEIEAQEALELRTLTTGYEPRPGTRRAPLTARRLG